MTRFSMGLMSAARAVGLGVGFLTILPVPWTMKQPDGSPEGSAEPAPWAVAFFPVVGLALGLVLYGLALAMSAWPSTSVAIFLVVALALLTAGIHLDGLADTVDAFSAAHGAGNRAEKALEVMKDPHIGFSGALSVILVLLAKIALLRLVPRAALPMAVLILPVLGRFPFLIFIPFAQYARPSGTGTLFAGAGWAQFLAGAGLTVLIFLTAGRTGLAAPGVAWTALGAVLLWALLLLAYFRRRLGGYTGDVLGAAAETSELVALIAMALLLRYA